MERLLSLIDPSALAGLAIVLLLFLCAALLYTMRDSTLYPQRVARRVRCPHQEDRKFTVEFSPAEPGTVMYCSAFPYGQLRCDQACLNAPRLPAAR